MDITRPAPPCPECGSARFWYGSVEFWVHGNKHSREDYLNVAVCSNCGYSSAYLQNMSKFRQDLAKMGLNPTVGGRPNTSGIDSHTGMPVSSGGYDPLAGMPVSSGGYDPLTSMPTSSNYDPLSSLPPSSSSNQPAFTSQEQPEMTAIRAALQSGNKIQAVKLYRELYGVSLREAVSAINRMF